METEQQRRRGIMEGFVRRAGWTFVLRDQAAERWNGPVTVRIAERGTFPDLPVKGWTNTATGTIFLREEIFDGIDLGQYIYLTTMNVVVNALNNGTPVSRPWLNREVGTYHLSEDVRETAWRVAQTVVANYGVLGHEYGHAAFSEHARRNSWHMGLEDLRDESLWMAQDPIRARQGLRACAGNWVVHDSSPMAGDREFDLSTRVRSHADLLHLYLLVVGRGRIGVLDDRSSLVTGVRGLAEEVLGWEMTSDANDIIDRFLETSEDLTNDEGAKQRAALAKEFAALLPDEAGDPQTGGCVCGYPSDDSDGGEGDDNDSDSDAGDAGEGGGSGKGKEGKDEGEGSSTGAGKGTDKGTDKGETSESGESGASGDNTDRGLTIGSNDAGGDVTGAGAGTDGDKGGETPNFITGNFGEVIRPGAETVTDELDISDAYRLTSDEVRALTEVLTKGLKEVDTDDTGIGWSMSVEEGAILTSRMTSPAKVFSEVFSRRALTTRNRRVKLT